jgi:hypothetical protein
MGHPPKNLLPMEPLLLVKDDYAAYADMPESLDMDRLRPHILAAQLHRLRPVLTDLLADELLRLVTVERQAPSDAPAPLVGAWLQLKAKAVPLVACASLARYMPFAQTTITSHSLVKKTTQYSETVEGRDLARMASIYDGEAISHEATLRTWLHANGKLFIDFYPQASCCGQAEAASIPMVVVQAIRRPEDIRATPRYPRELPATPVVPTLPTTPVSSRIFEPQFESQFE